MLFIIIPYTPISLSSSVVWRILASLGLSASYLYQPSLLPTALRWTREKIWPNCIQHHRTTRQVASLHWLANIVLKSDYIIIRNFLVVNLQESLHALSVLKSFLIDSCFIRYWLAGESIWLAEGAPLHHSTATGRPRWGRVLWPYSYSPRPIPIPRTPYYLYCMWIWGGIYYLRLAWGHCLCTANYNLESTKK